MSIVTRQNFLFGGIVSAASLSLTNPAMMTSWQSLPAPVDFVVSNHGNVSTAAIPQRPNPLPSISENWNAASVSTVFSPVKSVLEQAKFSIDHGKPWMRDSLKYGGYWTILGGSLLAAQTGMGYGLPDMALVAGISSAAFMANWALEHVIPYREDWKPSFKEMKIDSAHYFLSTGLFPAIYKALTFGSVIALGGALASSVGAESLWSYLNLGDLPMLAQLGIALGLGELGLYWGHRLVHEIELLWPFHEIHHSSEKLTGFHAARNNPVDTLKAYSMLIILGMIGLPHDVFTLATVFTAVNGFLQHSNADYDIGPGEYVISGPKVHRWHHSTIVDAQQNGDVVDEGNTNFGNNLIIWDHVPWHKIPLLGRLLKFQRTTFYLPEDRDGPEEVGVLDNDGTVKSLIDENKSVIANYVSHALHPFREIYRVLTS